MWRSHELYLKSYSCSNANEIRAVYDEWAPHYDTQMVRLGWQAPEQIAQMLAQRFSSDEKESAKVLDIGAGTGLVGMALARLGFQTIDAFDISDEMLGLAKMRSVYRAALLGDAHRLSEYLKEAYDAVVCVGALNFGHIGPEALREFARLLKPRGYICFSTRKDYYERASTSVQQALETDGTWHLVERKVQATSITDNIHFHWLYRS